VGSVIDRPSEPGSPDAQIAVESMRREEPHEAAPAGPPALARANGDEARSWSAPRAFDAGAPTVIVFLIAISIGFDLVSDIVRGVPIGHMAGMMAGTVLSVVCLAMMWRLVRASRSRARELEVALDSTRADLIEWRAKAAETLQGLGDLINRQFDAWELSPAECEVALLLLKGLSLKEIGGVRQSSERTVRQQAQAVYSKAGLAGRAELAAFFLEDLLLPRPPLAAVTPLPAASPARRR
jgi:DNA-binding CsgD family transcriptional regulator